MRRHLRAHRRAAGPTRRSRGLVVATAAACVLTACSGSTGASGSDPGSDSGSASGTDPGSAPSSTSSGPDQGAGVDSYVALGDSYTTAPYVPVTDLAGGCLRSTGNYPALLADQLGAELTDVSCSGADTEDLTGRQAVAGGRGSVPPQLDAVRRDTDLVTVGIGGNDEQLFGTLVQQCLGPDFGPTARCAELERSSGEVREVIARTGRRVTGVLRQVQRAAPDAQVVLVGYPRLVDPERGCAAFPLGAAELPRLSELERLLATTLRSAADRAGTGFADLYAASVGHEICSADPWVNGTRTDPQRALAFHPFAVEQEAAATRVLRVLRRPQR